MGEKLLLCKKLLWNFAAGEEAAVEEASSVEKNLRWKKKLPCKLLQCKKLLWKLLLCKKLPWKNLLWKKLPCKLLPCKKLLWMKPLWKLLLLLWILLL